MGAPGARASPVMEAPFLREGTTIRVLSDAPSRCFFSSGRCIDKDFFRKGVSIRAGFFCIVKDLDFK